MSGHDQIIRQAERTYDGPLPEHVRRAASAGSPREAARAQIRAELRFLGCLIRAQIAALRSGGAESGRLRQDLHCYRLARSRCRRVLATLP